MKRNPSELDSTIERCYNKECSIKEKCLRWLHREDLLAKHFIHPEGGENCELKILKDKD